MAGEVASSPVLINNMTAVGHSLCKLPAHEGTLTDMLCRAHSLSAAQERPSAVCWQTRPTQCAREYLQVCGGFKGTGEEHACAASIGYRTLCLLQDLGLLLYDRTVLMAQIPRG